jgi:hypothetical protein
VIGDSVLFSHVPDLLALRALIVALCPLTNTVRVVVVSTDAFHPTTSSFSSFGYGFGLTVEAVLKSERILAYSTFNDIAAIKSPERDGFPFLKHKVRGG